MNTDRDSKNEAENEALTPKTPESVEKTDDFKFLGDPAAAQTEKKDDKKLLKRLFPLLSLVLVAAVLFVGVVILKKTVPQTSDTPDTETNDSSIKLFDFTGTSAQRLEISNTVDKFAFVKKLEKTYVIEGKEDYAVNNSTILSTLTAVGSLSAATKVEDNVTDFEQYGLDSPTATVRWIKGDTVHYFEIGTLAPSGNYYLRVDGTATVYTYDSNSAKSFITSRMDYYDTAVFDFDEEQDASYINEFSITKKGSETLKVELQDLTDESLQSAYLIVSPITHSFSIERASGINEIMKTLTSCTVYDDDVSPENLKKYGLDEPEYTFSFTNVQVVNTAYFGKASDKGYTYMYAEGHDFVYIVDTDDINILTFNIAGYCETMSYSRSYDTIDRLSIVGGGKTYDIDITGTTDNNDMKAYINNKFVEYDNFASLYAHILSIDIKDIGEKKSSDQLLVTITVHGIDGTTDVLKYYKQSELNSFFEQNGTGRLIVPTAKVEQILKFAQQLYDGEEIVLEW